MNFRWRIAQFFELRWWQQYLRRQPWDEYLQWKKTYWCDFLEKTAFYPKNSAKILDAGCGPAGIFTVFAHQGGVHALDPLLTAYEKKLPGFKRENFPGVRFFVVPLEEFEPPHAYDAVFCLNAINHVGDIRVAMDRLAEAVGAGGHLILSIDAHRFSVLKTLFRMFPGDILHPHQYDAAEYGAMLERRGLTVVNTVLIRRTLIFDYCALVAEKT